MQYSMSVVWSRVYYGIQRLWIMFYLRLVRESVDGRLAATGPTRTRNFKFEIASRHLEKYNIALRFILWQRAHWIFLKKKQFCEMTSSESPITAATLWFLRQVHFGPKTLQSHGIKGGKIQAVKAVGGGNIYNVWSKAERSRRGSEESQRGLMPQAEVEFSAGAACC